MNQPLMTSPSGRVFVLGSHIAYSLSPVIQNSAFKAAGSSIRYGIRDIGEESFDEELKSIKQMEDLLGFNVTIPFKERIISYLSELDFQAKLTGAVNTVRRQDDIGHASLAGYNTDVNGVVASLSKLRLKGNGLEAVIIGSGGAARGCLAGLLNNGFDAVKILNRTEDRGKKLALEFSDKFPKKKVQADVLSRETFDNALREEVDLLVNTIPGRAVLPFDIKLQSASSAMRVFDVNYTSSESPILMEARRNSLVCIDGLLMLVEQAAKSFEIWTGIAAPRETMLRAAESARRAKN